MKKVVCHERTFSGKTMVVFQDHHSGIPCVHPDGSGAPYPARLVGGGAVILLLILIFVFISGYLSVDRLTRFMDETREDMYGYPPLRGAAGREHGTNACCRNISVGT